MAVLYVCRCALQSMGQYRIQLVLGCLTFLISLSCSFLVVPVGAPMLGTCILFEASASGDLRRGILREVYEKDTEMSGPYGLLSGKIDSLAPVFDSLRLWGLRAWQKSSILSEK